MKSTDVRKGNFIEYDGRFFRIDSISDEFPTLDSAEFGIGVVDWNNIKPIRLTADILRKVRGIVFKPNIIQHSYNIYMTRNRVLSVVPDQCNSFIYLCEHDESDKRKINDLVSLHNYDYDKTLYLHDFQNLYHGLNRYDLEIDIESGSTFINRDL